MRLSMQIDYAAGFKESADRAADLERAGIDIVWVRRGVRVRRPQSDGLHRRPGPSAS